MYSNVSKFEYKNEYKIEEVIFVTFKRLTEGQKRE